MLSTSVIQSSIIIIPSIKNEGQLFFSPGIKLFQDHTVTRANWKVSTNLRKEELEKFIFDTLRSLCDLQTLLLIRVFVKYVLNHMMFIFYSTNYSSRTTSGHKKQRIEGVDYTDIANRWGIRE